MWEVWEWWEPTDLDVWEPAERLVPRLLPTLRVSVSAMLLALPTRSRPEYTGLPTPRRSETEYTDPPTRLK